MKQIKFLVELICCYWNEAKYIGRTVDLQIVVQEKKNPISDYNFLTIFSYVLGHHGDAQEVVLGKSIVWFFVWFE